jgi:hypothetical protein
MAMSTFLRAAALNHTFRTATLDKPDFLYAGLLLTDPTPANSGTEVSTSGTGYARQPIAVEDASWSAPDDAAGYMATHNLIAIDWDPPSALWGTPAHWGLFDQVSGGNLWFYGAIQGTLREIDVTADPVSFAPESLNVSMGQAASDYLETAFLNHCLRTNTFTKPATIYAALHNVDPTDVGNIGEFTGTAYARVPISVANAAWAAPIAQGDAQMISNAGVLQFPTPGSDWGTYNYMSFNDAASGGNELLSAPMEIARIVSAFDNPPTWLPGAIKIFWS